jgi:hypothetical protein
MKSTLLSLVIVANLVAFSATAQTPAPPAGVVIEGEDFKPHGAGWKVVLNDHGNYMTDIIGFNHVSGGSARSAITASHIQASPACLRN